VWPPIIPGMSRPTETPKSGPQFPRLDPAGPAFWDVRFEAEFTPWDQGAVPGCLATYVKRHPQPASVLIPGCGAAHEIRLFLECGWPVAAIDFSPAAVAHAKNHLGALGAYVHEADFFAPGPHMQSISVIYERAFLCALPLHLRTAWAKRVAELLPPGGRLIGFFFFDQSEKGPPFGINRETLNNLLTPSFELLEEIAPTDSIPVFAGKERWQVWQKR
jgi:SAM-dependent methyltransferase